MTRKKLAVTFLILFVFSLVACITVRIKADSQKNVYKKVEVVTYSGKQLNNGMDLSAIEYVTYNNKVYKLRNSDTLKGSQAGQKLIAYLYKDKMYVDKEGAITSTPLYKVYYVFMFLTPALLITSLVLLCKKKNKKS